MIYKPDSETLYLKNTETLDEIDPYKLFIPSYLREDEKSNSRKGSSERGSYSESPKPSKGSTNSGVNKDLAMPLNNYFEKYRNILLKNTDKDFHIKYEKMSRYNKEASLLRQTEDRIQK